ncbi:hypothetical protein ABK040_008634 [Willaertia magna]
MLQQQETSAAVRRYPNILLTGTPGTGKTTIGEAVVKTLQETLNIEFIYLNVSEIAKQEQFVEEFDEERNTYVLDEDKLLDWMEEQLGNLEKGFIVDYHSSELFPERWFDCVIVLRTENNILFQRLEKRNYSEQKIKDNVECEIFQVCLDEALNSYKHEIITERVNNTVMDLDQNVQFIVGLVQNYLQQK